MILIEEDYNLKIECNDICSCCPIELLCDIASLYKEYKGNEYINKRYKELVETIEEHLNK